MSPQMIRKLFLRCLRSVSPSLMGLVVVLWAAVLLAQSSPTRVPPRVVPPRPPTGPSGVTFNKQVVRILQAHCQKCHHEGDIAPFPLVTYQDAFAHRAQIQYQTSNRVMPPWHVSSACSEFEGDPSLADQEIQTLSSWVVQGAPEGDPKDLPEPLAFPNGWSLGSPDLVLSMDEPVTPDLSRGDIYRCFVLPTSLTEDRYVSAVEVAPGSRAMVHHVLLFVDTSGVAERLDALDPGPGYTCFGGPGFLPTSSLGGWAPGNRPRPLPDGIGMLLPKSSRVVMQVHYSARSGVVTPDRTSVALYYSKQPVQKRLLVAPVINQNFRIPAGEKDHEVTASIPFLPLPIHVLSITPHMHLLGRKMRVTATTLDQRQLCLVDVPNWDFHWQATYSYKNPVALPAGTRVHLSARYDNSADNPENPNQPPQDVGWGENTTDEMCIAFLAFTLDAENLTGAGGLPATTPSSFDPFWEDGWPKPRKGLAREVSSDLGR